MASQIVWAIHGPIPLLREKRGRRGEAGDAPAGLIEWRVNFVIGDDAASKGPIMAKKAKKSQRQRSATVGPEMIVFVSWSKDSQSAAKLFCDWLPKVIQQVRVWHSEHIESGARWFATLSESLSANDFGVLMVTKKNHNEPWLQFEAGALAKALHAKVTPVFCNLSPLDVVSTPLQHLQGVRADQEGFRKLISDVNAACAKPLGQGILEDSFKKHWPEFDEAFREIKFESEAAPAVKAETETIETRIARIEDVLVAILRSSNQTTDALGRVVQALISQMSAPTGSGGYTTGSVVGAGPLGTPPPPGMAGLGLLSGGLFGTVPGLPAANRVSAPPVGARVPKKWK
jgi:hypothetical protein